MTLLWIKNIDKMSNYLIYYKDLELQIKICGVHDKLFQRLRVDSSLIQLNVNALTSYENSKLPNQKGNNQRFYKATQNDKINRGTGV